MTSVEKNWDLGALYILVGDILSDLLGLFFNPKVDKKNRLPFWD